MDLDGWHVVICLEGSLCAGFHDDDVEDEEVEGFVLVATFVLVGELTLVGVPDPDGEVFSTPIILDRFVEVDLGLRCSLGQPDLDGHFPETFSQHLLGEDSAVDVAVTSVCDDLFLGIHQFSDLTHASSWVKDNKPVYINTKGIFVKIL